MRSNRSSPHVITDNKYLSYLCLAVKRYGTSTMLCSLCSQVVWKLNYGHLVQVKNKVVCHLHTGEIKYCTG